MIGQIESQRKVMRSPQTVNVDVTNRCNLRCKYCFYFSTELAAGVDLPKEEWLQFFDELGRLAVMTVGVGGGEAFIREDLADIIGGIVKNRMRFGIISNGTLIDDSIAKYLASTHRCEYVQVSIDGSKPEIHDACRGEGSFRQAVQGIEHLRRYDLPVEVRVTINKHNMRDFADTAEFLLTTLGLPGFTCCNAFHMGLCRDAADSVQLDADDTSYVMEVAQRLLKIYPGRIGSISGPLTMGPYFERLEDLRKENRVGSSPGGYLLSCNGCYTKLAVRADGTVIPCGLLGHIELGRINQASIQDIWLNHPELKRMRNRTNTPLSTFEFCDGCEYMPNCSGGCPATAYSMTGKDEHPSPDSCFRLFRQMGGKLPRESRDSQ